MKTQCGNFGYKLVQIKWMVIQSTIKKHKYTKVKSPNIHNAIKKYFYMDKQPVLIETSDNNEIILQSTNFWY